MDFLELTIILFMFPANERQHIDAVSAVGKAIFQDATGIVPFLKVETGRVQAALILPGNEQRAFQGLNGFLDVPTLARDERYSAMNAFVEITFDNLALCIWKISDRAVSRLLEQYVFLVSEFLS